jgi:hypothetical protein
MMYRVPKLNGPRLCDATLHFACVASRPGREVMVRNSEPPSAFRVVAATESHPRRATMPIILWLLGVPLSLIIILALLGVF